MADGLKRDLKNSENDFIDYLTFERQLSKNTVISYKQDLKKLNSHIFSGDVDPYDLSKDEILSLLERLHKDNNEKSISRFLSTMRSFYRFMIREGRIKKNPFDKITNPKSPKKVLKVLTEEEVKKYLESIPQSTHLELRDRAMMEVLYSCGLRVSELVNLKLSEVDLDEGILRFIGKGGKERITLIGATALKFLGKYLKSARHNIEKEKKNEFVFLNSRGDGISRQGLWKILKKYAKRIGMEDDIYPHIFRHSFATHLLQRGADLRVVQELLGHSSINTTEIYTDIDKRHIKDAYFKFHPRQS